MAEQPVNWGLRQASEQALASLPDIVPVVAGFYKQLRKQGLSDKTATKLTVAWIQASFGRDTHPT